MGLGLYTTFALVGVQQWIFATILGAVTLCSLGMPYAVRRSGVRWERALRGLLLVSAIVAVVSVVTGIGNNGTDENRTTPAFLGELWRGENPYSTLLVLHYRIDVLNLLPHSVTSASYEPYLPLLTFLQIPGTGYLGYDAVCLGSWASLVYVLRKDEFAALVLATPMVALVAANGFNDLPVLLLTTLALRGPVGRATKVAEFLTYGLKQFANLFWVGYFAVHRRWWRLLGVVAGTVAIALPFVLWQPQAFWCHAVVLNAGAGCGGYGTGQATPVGDFPHWDYYLWAVWLVALFPATTRAWLVRLRDKLAPGSRSAAFVEEREATIGARQVGPPTLGSETPRKVTGESLDLEHTERVALPADAPRTGERKPPAHCDRPASRSAGHRAGKTGRGKFGGRPRPFRDRCRGLDEGRAS